MNAFCVAVDDLSAAIGNDVEKDKNFAMLVSSIKSTIFLQSSCAGQLRYRV